MNSPEPIEILLVEDNPNDAKLTQRALEKMNLINKLHWVKDGAEALDYIFRAGAYAKRANGPNPKLILLDLKLPKINGLEVLQKLKSNEQTRLIPVVVLTSSAEDRDVLDCYKLGVNSYIVKPVNASKFVETVSGAGLYWMVTNTAPR